MGTNANSSLQFGNRGTFLTGRAKGALVPLEPWPLKPSPIPGGDVIVLTSYKEKHFVFLVMTYPGLNEDTDHSASL